MPSTSPGMEMKRREIIVLCTFCRRGCVATGGTRAIETKSTAIEELSP